MRTTGTLLAAVALLASAPSEAAIVTNGEFDTGDFTGWTLFTNPSGTLGRGAYPGDLDNPTFPRPPKPATPSVQSFDTDGDGLASLAATFDAGKEPLGASEGGGGLYQVITTGAGTLELQLAVAVWLPLFSNGDAGTFTLSLNGVELDRHAFGEVDTGFPRSTAGKIVRASLFASTQVASGTHDLRIGLLRPSTNSEDTPLQYLDHVRATFTPVPLPPAGLLLAAALPLLWRRQSSANRGNRGVWLKGSECQGG